MLWKDAYAVGIPEIDDQHKTLLGFITGFERAVDGLAQWNTVPPLMAQSREFLQFHFAVEESLMQAVGYPRLAAHRAEHQYVLGQFAILETRVLLEETKGELLPLVHFWLFQHIIDSDRPFARYAVGAHARPACAASG